MSDKKKMEDVLVKHAYSEYMKNKPHVQETEFTVDLSKKNEKDNKSAK